MTMRSLETSMLIPVYTMRFMLRFVVKSLSQSCYSHVSWSLLAFYLWNFPEAQMNPQALNEQC